MLVGSEEKLMCHTSGRSHVIILTTWILTDTRRSKNIHAWIVWTLSLIEQTVQTWLILQKHGTDCTKERCWRNEKTRSF